MKKRTSIFSCKTVLFHAVLLTFLLSGALFGQISEKGTPKSFDIAIDDVVPTVFMPSVNLNRYLAEDQQDADDKDIPFRFGAQIDVDFSLNTSGIWSELPDGGRVWRLRITSPGALSLNLLYDNFFMPEGAQFFVYNDDRSNVLGAFTDQNNKDKGTFATGLTAGDAVTLEYYEPATVREQGILEVSRVVHAYRDIMGQLASEGFGSSGSCNNNVACPEAEDWQNEVRSVAMILTGGGSRICSGSMVNNVRGDMTPYFLTANHCLGGNDSWIIMFKYQSPSCENVDGPTNFTVQGTTLLANNSSSDFALLLLDEAPPEDYEVHFAGWSAINEAASQVVGIHHPAGDIKKISWYNSPVESSDYDPSPYLADSHWEIADWDDGTTEGGSSGSPLFDQNKRVVGQLHGGWASCTSATQDYYGKFSMSWDYGSTAASRLKDWLDPDNTGTLTLDGWDPSIGEPDDVPPTPIVDLTVDAITSSEIAFSWSAPSDTSYGGVRGYDIRYSTTAINDTNAFANATPISGNVAPAAAGEQQVYTIEDLDFATTYYIAIRARDMWNNWSALSNVVSAQTYVAPEMDITPASVNVTMNQGGSATETVNIANVTTDNSTLDYTIELLNNTFPESKAVQVKLIQKNINSEVKFAKGEEAIMGGSSLKGAGGPDNYGYEWIDSDEANGPSYQWQDISSEGQLVQDWTATGTFGARDEGIAGPYDLGFDFSFYGTDYSQVYFGTNGFISFGSFSGSTYTNAAIPGTAAPNNIIAAVWDDLDGSDGGDVYYLQDGNKFIIQYDNWPEYNDSGTYTFQIVLYSSGKVMIYYNTLTGDLSSATVGIENSTGSDGLQISYNSVYLQDNFAIKIASEPDWVQASNQGGRLYNGNSVDVELTFTDDEYPQGNYSMDMVVKSNDPNAEEVVVPITMTLGEGGNTATVSMNMAGDWNMLSIPVDASDMSVSGIFPEATTQAYGFDNGYYTTDNFDMGSGYWLKFDSPVSHSITGNVYYDEVDVAEGWNLVGFYNTEVPVENITSDPVGIVNSLVYGYDNGYFVATTIQPGKAYWVKTSAAGEIGYSQTVKKENSGIIAGADRENWNAITVTDAAGHRAVLYTSEDKAGEIADMPPMPPAGVFDVRFSTNKLVETISTSQRIDIAGAEFPVVISANSDLRITAAGEVHMLKKGERVVLSNSVTSVEIGSAEIPQAFQLSQNYPNPFNPSTRINFALPENSVVELSVYDMLGQKLYSTGDMTLEAGTHFVDLNASQFSSGVYLYTVSAKGGSGENFVDTKKMILMK